MFQCFQLDISLLYLSLLKKKNTDITKLLGAEFLDSVLLIKRVNDSKRWILEDDSNSRDHPARRALKGRQGEQTALTDSILAVCCSRVSSVGYSMSSPSTCTECLG